jgi:mono/diheme cytochrome c family protein
MKSKIVSLAVFSFVLFSCASKTVVLKPTPKEEVKAVVLSTALAEGKNLYNNNCANCHKLFEAKTFTQEEWKPILSRMQKKAHLDDTQMASVSDYITSQL